MCAVTFPGTAPALWGGIYGTAKVSEGDDAEAITSDGKKHPL